MCTYVTENVAVAGSAKGSEGWARVDRATVYFDHPYHAPFEHSLNIDFADAGATTVTSVRSGGAPAGGAASGAPPASALEAQATTAVSGAPIRRVAVELSAASARALAQAILATLDTGEASIGESSVGMTATVR